METDRESNTSFSPGHTKVGWVGTGVMGSSMAGHLIDAGYSLTVFNRTKSKADSLVERGATYADTPADVAADADVIFTIVGYPEDVRGVYLSESGILEAAKSGATVVDMTTSDPSLATEIHEAAAKKQIASIDAPVSGGDVGAKNGMLSIMVGGEAQAVEKVMPLLECFGKTIVRQGGPGAGQHTKMVNQTLIATNMIGVCEALLYARKAGLDLETVLKSVSGGAAGSWSLSNLAPRIIAGDFAPGFYVEHFLKDMGIALAEARRMNLALPGLSLAEQLYRAVAAQGHARSGTQALELALAELSAVEWPVTKS
ncbi:NAD(P)-dependent oxidoreductase [Stratiformator vulcanicus]